MAKDPREYGYEGEMAMSQLKGIMQHAKQLHGMLKPDTDLPEWVQSKITLSYDYLQTAADYMATEMNEEAGPSYKEELPHILKDIRGKRKGHGDLRREYGSNWKRLANSTADEYGHNYNRSHLLATGKKHMEEAMDNTQKNRNIASKAGSKLAMDPDTKTPDYFTAAMRRKKGLPEEAPANSVCGGKIAGMGVGAQGEPGVGPKAMKRYKDKNAAEAPKAGRKAFSLFMKSN
jgi:hypothetical protein